MTERGASAVHRTDERFTIGPSRVEWNGTSLVYSIEERSMPTGRPVRGSIRVTPGGRFADSHPLDAAARHRWQPVSPDSRIEVSLREPALMWEGPAYVDQNHGVEPMERAFSRWTWTRVPLAAGSVVTYVTQPHEGGLRALSLRLPRAGGTAEPIPLPQRRALPRSRWGIEQWTYGDADGPCSIERRLEDTPFYARSALRLRLDGEPVRAVQEFLSLDRFSQPWVQAMLPFRMPRRA